MAFCRFIAFAPASSLSQTQPLTRFSNLCSKTECLAPAATPARPIPAGDLLTPAARAARPVCSCCLQFEASCPCLCLAYASNLPQTQPLTRFWMGPTAGSGGLGLMVGVLEGAMGDLVGLRAFSGAAHDDVVCGGWVNRRIFFRY